MPMGVRTAEMSFGKFLELSFYEDTVCGHLIGWAVLKSLRAAPYTLLVLGFECKQKTLTAANHWSSIWQRVAYWSPTNFDTRTFCVRISFFFWE
jgi:hypothetical protein